MTTPRKKATAKVPTLKPKDVPSRTADTTKGGRAKQAFSSVSNVLKTRHDTVKNSIGN